MRRINKILYLLPLALLAVGCSKKVNDNTTTKPTETEEKTTTEKKYDVKVDLSLENAATITGSGSFKEGSNTTITITTNDGYNYLGLYNGDKLVTEETTYEITNITTNINLMAKFSANIYALNTELDDTTYGTLENLNGNYDCGSKVVLRAYPIEGYVVDSWYANGTLISNEQEYCFTMPAYDVTITATFKVATFTLTINDNLEDEDGLYYVDEEEYINALTFEYGKTVGVDFWNILGYNYDYAEVNGEYSGNSYIELYMDKDYTIDVFYELASMYFSFNYDPNKVLGSSFDVNPKPDDFSYDSSDGYLSGYYDYKTQIVITMKIRTEYDFVGIKDSDDNIIGKSSYDKGVTTVTIDILDEYYLKLDVLGKECVIKTSCDEIQGEVTLGGTYHYGDEIEIKATPKKGYKFVKWTDADGNAYSTTSTTIYLTVKGNSTIIAIFTPDEFEVEYYLVSNETKLISTYYYTYLTKYDLQAEKVDGYTFIGWLNSSDSEEVFSEEEIIDFTMTNENTKVYAKYNQNEYTITYDFNGGSAETLTQKVLYNGNFTAEIPSKEKLTFNGYYAYFDETTYTVGTSVNGMQIYWYLDRYLNLPYNFFITNKYLYLNDELVTDGNTTIKNGDIIRVLAHITDNKVIDKNGNGFYNLAYDAKLVADWICTVTYEDYDGSCINHYTYRIGEKAFNYTFTESRTGYTYKYWTLNGEKYDFNTILETNITLVAYYEVNKYNLKVTEKLSNNRATVNYTNSFIAFGDVITLELTENTGYYFSYWYIKTTNTYCYEKSFEFTMPANDVQIEYRCISFDVWTYVNDSTMGSVDVSTINTVLFDETLTITPTPKEGYGFVNWTVYKSDEVLSTDLKFVFTPSTLDYDITSGIDYDLKIQANFGILVTDNYERLGNKVWFGYYPQTCLNPNLQDQYYPELIAELKELAGDLPTLDSPANYEATKNNTNWINYDYYIYPGGLWNKSVYNTTTYKYDVTYLKAPHMWYIDIDYDEDGRYDYRGVLIYSYRSDEIKVGTPDSTSHQNANSFGTSSIYRTYWFKYEKIEWDILENNDGTYKMIANLAIDSQNFSLSSNSYDSSYIRDFLNDNFYNTAFNSLENGLMKTMAINSNNDYVTLLTKEEIESYYSTQSDRFVKPTDYAMSQNCNVNTSEYSSAVTKGNCYWLTRSAYTTSGNIYYVSFDGSINSNKTNMTYYGIRPVISVTL